MESRAADESRPLMGGFHTGSCRTQEFIRGALYGLAPNFA